MSLEKLGPYRVTRMLGRGGMGAVYEGVHSQTGERAAVKILSAGFADDEAFRTRFITEIETLKTLHHPNIVRLIGFGEQDGVLFYSMELVEGTNLHDAVRGDKRLSWKEVAEIGIQVCSALKHAHDHGVIHRDLKPANLMRTADGTVKLTDFGIAKLFGSTQLTSAGGVIGTVDYMSPEQADGKPVTAKSDLYSLGCVLYALLTGRPPFAGKSAADVLQRLRSSEPTPPRYLNPDVPWEFEEIILQLLQRDPQQRVPTALVLARRLSSMLFGLAGLSQAQESATSEPSPSDQEPNAAKPPRSTECASDSAATREVTPSRWGDIPWEDETIGTGPGVQPKVDKTGETSSGRGGGTYVQTSFTAVEENQAAANAALPMTTGRALKVPWRHMLSIAGLIGALAVLIIAGVYLMQPPTADTLYRRIQEVVADAPPGELLAARRDIDEFLRYYPDDPRSDEIRMLQAAHDAYRVWRRLEREARKAGGIEYLSDVERAFVLAMRAEGNDPREAETLHETLLQKYGGRDTSSETARECIELSRAKLAGLKRRTTPLKSESPSTASGTPPSNP